MPYIGNSHIVGDHINNFKVLDDISSYTATFDGSSTDVVSTTNETLRIVEHRFVQGQRVTYNNGGGSNIGGLASGTAYYVSFDTANTIKLATSLVNANNGTLINLTSAGGGTSHTLTAAFDGINTKFKLTHNSGESGRFNNATQLQVAINNVLQRPNSDPDNFTEGFAVEGGNKIVFQTAPTSNDIFWGSIIANSLPTFDIDAAAIDNFTGDGSTTDFTLSRIPPNNASIIVTINGVFQHLSDTTTARAYSLEASVIKFTSAPASGDEIQVRHTGFRGALGDIVTGFYGRTGNVSLIASDDILTRNINSSGIITASSFSGDGSGLIGVASTDNIVTGTAATFNTYPVDINAGMTVAGVATFAGNVSIAGTLTYEDVTNIDSVGIITAQKDIHVGAGVSAVGVGTFGSLDIVGDIDLPDSSKLKLGTGDDFQMFFGGANSVINHTPIGMAGGALFIQSNNLILRGYNPGNQYLTATYNDGTRLYHNNLLRIQTLSDGIQITNTSGGSNPTKLRVNANEGQNAELHLIADQGDDNNDNWKISSDGSTNNLNFQNYNGSAWETGISIAANGAVELYHDNIKRLETSSVGVSIPQDLDVDGHTNLDNVSIAGITTGTIFKVPDSTNSAGATNNITIGNSADLTLYHNGTDSRIDNRTGSLQIRSNGGVNIEGATSGGHADFLKGYSTGDRRVELYNSDIVRLTTTTAGVNVSGTTTTTGLAVTGVSTFTGNIDANGDLDVDGHTNLDNVSIAGVTTFTGDAHFKGGAEAIKVFGDSDIRFAYGTWTGNTSTPKIQAHNNYLYIAGGASGIIFRENATNRWQIDGNGNLEPSTDSTYDIGESNLRVRNGYFDTLYGDGSNLTNVISGVDVKFEGASVGTGVTMLNFVGFNTVTPPVSGLSTITSGQNLTIGVRSGSAVEASLTGTSFNVIARSGGNISINI